MKIRPRDPCHYCGGRATTRDHIVPKSLMASKKYDPYFTNFVACCVPCNVKKANKRSDCNCLTCTRAWTVYGPLLEQVEIVRMVESEADTAMDSLP